MKRVLLLTHPRFPLGAWPYIKRIAEHGSEAGWDVRIASGLDALESADVAVPFIPLTIRPPEHQEALLRYPTAVNGRITDISKRRNSRLRLARGGLRRPRHRQVERQRPRRGRLAHGLGGAGRRLRGRGLAGPGASGELERPGPDRGAVRAGRRAVLGPQVGISGRPRGRLPHSSESPVAQGPDLVFREALREVPDELRRLRAELGLDFGGIDYGVADGRVFVYDLNWSPGFCAELPAERAREMARTLAAGLDRFLR